MKSNKLRQILALLLLLTISKGAFVLAAESKNLDSAITQIEEKQESWLSKLLTNLFQEEEEKKENEEELEEESKSSELRLTFTSSLGIWQFPFAISSILLPYDHFLSYKAKTYRKLYLLYHSLKLPTLLLML